MGKTLLWRQGLGEAEERSYTVLIARPSSAETDLSFAGQQVVSLPAVQNGTVSVKITSSRKKVEIDALGVSAK